MTKAGKGLEGIACKTCKLPAYPGQRPFSTRPRQVTGYDALSTKLSSGNPLEIPGSLAFTPSSDEIGFGGASHG
jgi:hypothetical protein